MALAESPSTTILQYSPIPTSPGKSMSRIMHTIGQYLVFAEFEKTRTLETFVS